MSGDPPGFILFLGLTALLAIGIMLFLGHRGLLGSTSTGPFNESVSFTNRAKNGSVERIIALVAVAVATSAIVGSVLGQPTISKVVIGVICSVIMAKIVVNSVRTGQAYYTGHPFAVPKAFTA